jgi:hypothetical protein
MIETAPGAITMIELLTQNSVATLASEAVGNVAQLASEAVGNVAQLASEAVGNVATLASEAANNFGDTRTGGLAGPTAFVIILLLVIGTVLLIRNMNARLRRLPGSFDRTPSTDEQPPQGPEDDEVVPRSPQV